MICSSFYRTDCWEWPKRIEVSSLQGRPPRPSWKDVVLIFPCSSAVEQWANVETYSDSFLRYYTHTHACTHAHAHTHTSGDLWTFPASISSFLHGVFPFPFRVVREKAGLYPERSSLFHWWVRQTNIHDQHYHCSHAKYWQIRFLKCVRKLLL